MRPAVPVLREMGGRHQNYRQRRSGPEFVVTRNIREVYGGVFVALIGNQMAQGLPSKNVCSR